MFIAYVVCFVVKLAFNFICSWFVTLYFCKQPILSHISTLRFHSWLFLYLNMPVDINTWHAVKGGTHLMFNPHMHEIFLLLSCVKWVPGTHKKKCSSNWTKWHSFHIILQKQLCVGSPGTDTLIFGDHFYLKNHRKLRFHVLLLYSKVKLAEMVEIHILLRIWSTFGKMMASYVF